MKYLVLLKAVSPILVMKLRLKDRCDIQIYSCLFLRIFAISDVVLIHKKKEEIRMKDCRWLYASIVIISLLGSSSSSRALSCREQVRAGAEDPISCARVTRHDLRLPSLNLDDDWKTPQKVNDKNNGITYDTILNMWVSGSTGGTTGTVGATVADQNKDFDPMKLPGVCRY